MNKRFDALIYINARLNNYKSVGEREMLKRGLSFDDVLSYLSNKTCYKYNVITVSGSKYVIRLQDNDNTCNQLKETLDAFIGNETLAKTTTLHEAKTKGE